MDFFILPCMQVWSSKDAQNDQIYADYLQVTRILSFDLKTPIFPPAKMRVGRILRTLRSDFDSDW